MPSAYSGMVAREATLGPGCRLTFVAADRALACGACGATLLDALQLNVSVRPQQPP